MMNNFILSFFRNKLRSLSNSERTQADFSFGIANGHGPYVFILILIGIVTHHSWFTSLSIMSYGDWLVDTSEKTAEYFNLPQAWAANSLGGRDIGGVYWPFMFFAGFLTQLNFSPELIERIIFLWPVALLTPVCMYAFSFYILQSKAGAFTSAIAYTFGTPLVVASTGIITTHMAMTLTPLLMLVYFIALEEESLLYTLLSALLILAIGFYDFRFLYMVAWILFFFTVFHFLIFNEKNKFFSQNVLVLLALLTFLVILLNLYWLPNLFQSGFGSGVLSRGLFGSSFVDLTKSIFLFVYLWSGTEITAFKVQPIPIIFLPIPFLAVLGLFFSKGKNKYILYFSFVGLLGIFFTKMDHEPFTEIYGWFHSNVPGFNAFRESTKFYFYIALGYAVLIGAFVKHYAAKPSHRVWVTALRICLIIFVNAIFLWNAKPLITEEIRTVYIPRNMPSDYLLLQNYMKQQEGFYRTLYIPRESRWGYYTNQHPKLSSIDLFYGGWKSYVTDKNLLPLSLLSIFQQDFSSNLLNLSAVRYVIVPTRDTINDDDFFIYYGNRRSQYIHALDQLPYLKRINIGASELVVYENKSFRPHIYVTADIESVYKSPSFDKVNFDCIQPTQCKIHLTNIKTPVYLNFAENFDIGWKIIAGNVSWYERSSENKELPSRFHLNNDAALNSFYIDVEYFKKHFPNDYEVNQDGSINLNLTLYFKAQNAIKLGTLISIITFLALFFYILSQMLIKIKFRKN